MRSYKADLSSRLGPVFAEQAAQPNTTEPARPATERYFTVVYKLTDANVAKYLSNRDWVTYVYADSRAELANLKEISAEPAAPTQPVAWVLHPDDAAGLPAPSKAYKPAHGGYPSAGARA